MLLIYVDRQTNRLGYTINLIFKELLKVDFMVTTSREQFIALGGAKLSYCEHKIYDEVHISSSDLLFETNIYSKEIDYIKEDNIPKLFRNYGKDDSLGFDIFAATFYMVSRYEEYLPFIRDEHLRFCVKDSIAYQKDFCNLPVVNIWAEYLKQKLSEKYPKLEFVQRQFSFINTVDIDMAYCYKGKGFYRSTGGFVRDIVNRKFDLCVKRIKVLFGIDKDPYDCFDYLLNIINKYKLKSIFFFLFGMQSKYDKNISPYNNSFQMLLKNFSDYTEIGLHPSYYAMEYPKEIASQKKLMSSIIHKSITSSRFHFLRFRLPQSYRDLLNNGITDDYSMGYADYIGFRAGICTPYNFYDLEKDCETNLKVHPFMFMDVVLKNKLKLSCDEAWDKIKNIIDEVRNVNGEMLCIWHNESLSDAGAWRGWRSIYEKQVDYITNIKQ